MKQKKSLQFPCYLDDPDYYYTYSLQSADESRLSPQLDK